MGKEAIFSLKNMNTSLENSSLASAIPDKICLTTSVRKNKSTGSIGPSLPSSDKSIEVKRSKGTKDGLTLDTGTGRHLIAAQGVVPQCIQHVPRQCTRAVVDGDLGVVLLLGQKLQQAGHVATTMAAVAWGTREQENKNTGVQEYRRTAKKDGIRC
jgi:hypothetical protein